MAPLFPRQLDEFIAGVIPELQRRGLYRTRYEADTAATLACRGPQAATRAPASPPRPSFEISQAAIRSAGRGAVVRLILDGTSFASGSIARPRRSRCLCVTKTSSALI